MLPRTPLKKKKEQEAPSGQGLLAQHCTQGLERLRTAFMQHTHKPGNSDIGSIQHYKWLQWRQKIAALKSISWNPKGVWCFLAQLVKKTRQRLIQPKLHPSTVWLLDKDCWRPAEQEGWGWMRLCNCTGGWIQMGWEADWPCTWKAPVVSINDAKYSSAALLTYT